MANVLDNMQIIAGQVGFLGTKTINVNQGRNKENCCFCLTFNGTISLLFRLIEFFVETGGTKNMAKAAPLQSYRPQTVISKNV